MSLIKPADFIRFANDEIQYNYDSLDEYNWLKKSITKAINNIRNNIFCGEPIKKRQIPKKISLTII